MTKEELNKLVTIEDLENFTRKLISEIKQILENQKGEKEFYSPKEFGNKTGLKYSTVVYRCKIGILKARQDYPGCSWLIYKSELERLIQEANEI